MSATPKPPMSWVNFATTYVDQPTWTTHTETTDVDQQTWTAKPGPESTWIVTYPDQFEPVKIAPTFKRDTLVPAGTRALGDD